ncbi:MAG TPA: prepilin-type N-terminal cleavage/methylation domain-containing protein [Candidatus Saccharimonadales bacterium]|nr:prepilin-type N-terminal cleavage/methylation domain-containing protein [Candidatus Saccharimonadales bacterium]
MKTKLRNQKGFTIIEVLIVLAIAGLILLIVFLAVPALQRNSRNTQRRSDVAGTLAGIGEYANNHGGTMPTTCVAGTAAGQCDATGAVAQWLTNVKLGFFSAASVQFTNNAAAVAPAGPAAGVTNFIDIQTNTRCNATNDGTVVTNASPRSFVALFRTETGGGDTLVCQESGA